MTWLLLADSGGRTRATLGSATLTSEAYNLGMAEQILTHETQLLGSDGRNYRVRSLGEPQLDGPWIGWLEFRPVDGSLPVRQTGRETTQPNREALVYWATGLEPVYLEGAFTRAR
jgi:hypothetical protein